MQLCLTLSLRIDPVTSSSLRCRLNLGGMLLSGCSSWSGSLFRKGQEKIRTSVKLCTALKSLIDAVNPSNYLNKWQLSGCSHVHLSCTNGSLLKTNLKNYQIDWSDEAPVSITHTHARTPVPVQQWNIYHWIQFCRTLSFSAASVSW